MEMINSKIPTPPATPSPSPNPFTLSERINAATRPVHGQLNRLILARLPLALPPHATNPSTYISGILHIAPIYVTFESLWNSIINAPRLPTSLAQAFDVCDPAFPIVDAKTAPVNTVESISGLVHTPKVCSRTNSLLSHLRLPGLLRAGRLRADIRILTRTPEHKIDEQLESVARHGKLADFIAHITRSVEANPHVLLAYVWVLYMALFSGGRYLRASLSEAGGFTEFWSRDPSPVRPYSITKGTPTQRRRSRSASSSPNPERRSRPKSRSENAASKSVPGLQFFDFIGDEDGEDIKIEFKKRITEVEGLLTDGEKEDIILEAQRIFEFMLEMVTELDTVMGTTTEDVESAILRRSSKHMASRDTIPLAKESLLKTKPGELHPLAIDRPWKPNDLLRLFSNPVARLISFKELLQGSFVKHLARTFPGKWKRRTSVDFQEAFTDSENLIIGLRGIITILPLLALFVVFAAWYWMT